MKKIITLIAVAATCLSMQAQENNTWRFGVQWGGQANRSHYAGGMDGASARFHQSPFGATSFGLMARYDLNNRWMFTTGIGNSANGFEFALAENYSFVGKSKRFTEIKAGTPNFEIPLLVSYKFNPNCNNWRWFVSGGLSNVFVTEQSLSQKISQSNDGPSTTSYMSADITNNVGNHIQARWAVGREKMFKCGSILSFELLANFGFSEMYHATVNYSVDGQNYMHEFSNRGSFFGFRVAYFIRPVNSFKARSAKPKNAATVSSTSAQ